MATIIIRRPSPEIAACELTYQDRVAIDYERILKQHRDYEATLRGLGHDIERLPALEGAADAVFVEDTAIVLDEVAVITRPGAASRRRETDSIATALDKYRMVQHLGDSGSLEGGDVLRVGRTLFVGQSSRTNLDGIRALEKIVRDYDYQVLPVEVSGCLHLKTGVTALNDQKFLINQKVVDPMPFTRHGDLVDVDPREPNAANILRLPNAMIYSTSYPETAKKIIDEVDKLVLIEYDEMEKAEAGMTCSSLVF